MYRFVFKFMVQAVLIFGWETWVVTSCIGKALGGFGPGGKTDDGIASAEDTRREVDIHLSGDGTGGGGAIDDGGMHQTAP